MNHFWMETQYQPVPVRPSIARPRLKAALTRVRCLKACGVLPSCSPEAEGLIDDTRVLHETGKQLGTWRYVKAPEQMTRTMHASNEEPAVDIAVKVIRLPFQKHTLGIYARSWCESVGIKFVILIFALGLSR